MSDPKESLTAPDLDGFAEHYGVRLSFIGDDGDWVVALGHHEPRRFVAALSRYTRVDLGWRLALEWLDATYEGLAEAMEHRWCVIARACSAHGDVNRPDCGSCADVRAHDWWLRWDVTQDAPGAFPVTVISA